MKSRVAQGRPGHPKHLDKLPFHWAKYRELCQGKQGEKHRVAEQTGAAFGECEAVASLQGSGQIDKRPQDCSILGPNPSLEQYLNVESLDSARL